MGGFHESGGVGDTPEDATLIFIDIFPVCGGAVFPYRMGVNKVGA